MTDRHLEFQVEKQGIGQIWPRLMVKQQKPAWLKIDFDKFAVEDDSDDEVKGDTGKVITSRFLSDYNIILLLVESYLITSAVLTKRKLF